MGTEASTRMEKLGINKSDLQNVEVPADIMAGIMKILAVEEPQEVPEAKPPASQPELPQMFPQMSRTKEPAPVIDVDKQLFPDLEQVYGADGAPDAAAGEEHDVPAEASEEGYSSLLGDGGDEWGDFCEPEAAELEAGEPEGWDDGEWQQCEQATVLESEQWQHETSVEEEPTMRSAWTAPMADEHKAKILGAMKGFDPDIIRIQRRKAKEKKLKEKALKEKAKEKK